MKTVSSQDHVVASRYLNLLMIENESSIKTPQLNYIRHFYSLFVNPSYIIISILSGYYYILGVLLLRQTPSALNKMNTMKGDQTVYLSHWHTK